MIIFESNDRQSIQFFILIFQFESQISTVFLQHVFIVMRFSYEVYGEKGEGLLRHKLFAQLVVYHNLYLFTYFMFLISKHNLICYLEF